MGLFRSSTGKRGVCSKIIGVESGGVSGEEERSRVQSMNDSGWVGRAAKIVWIYQ